MNWSKVTVKTIIILQKISVSNEFCSFELSTQSIMKKCKNKNIIAANSIDNTKNHYYNNWAESQHIRMISEGKTLFLNVNHQCMYLCVG